MLWFCDYASLSTAKRQVSKSAFPGHGSGQPKDLFNRHRRSHADATLSRTQGCVVYDQNAFHVYLRIINFQNLFWTPLICKKSYCHIVHQKSNKHSMKTIFTNFCLSGKQREYSSIKIE